MDRRGFFKKVLHGGARQAVDHVEARANRAAERWIRPPFAVAELDFLLACTRCGDCITACPHDVIFSLASRLGPQVAGTPALDLLNRGCHLCDDWPCVTACAEPALTLPGPPDEAEGPASPPLPLLALASIDRESCLPWQGPECGACEGSCPVSGALRWEAGKPVIDPSRCVGCGLCRQACIVEPGAVTLKKVTEPPQARPSPVPER